MPDDPMPPVDAVPHARAEGESSDRNVGALDRGERESAPPPASLRTMPASSERLINTVVDGRYLLTREIGRGGICAVFLAEHRYTRRHYALKTLLPDYRTHQEARARLLAEARLLGTVRHPNVVEVIDAGMDRDGSPFVVMERLRAKSVDALLVARGKLTVHDSLTIAMLAAKALAATHRAGVVHRDVKPGNLLVVRTEAGKTLKLIDFGVATFHHTFREEDGPPSAIVGTPYYMAPEYIAGKGASPASDVYSFGATLFECLTGQVPFAGSFEQVYAKSMTSPRPDVMRLRPDSPPALAKLVASSLAPDPRDRYASGVELSAALEGISSATNEGASSPSMDTSRRGHVRVPYQAPIEMQLPAGDVVEGAIQDLSAGGLLVTTNRNIPEKVEVVLRFPLPSGLIVVGSALVRWAREAHSSTAVGLEFSELEHAYKQAIAEYVRSVEPT
jgi:serine/threonine protein kinase